MPILYRKVHDKRQDGDDEAGQGEDAGPQHPVESCHAGGAVHASFTTLGAGEAFERVEKTVEVFLDLRTNIGPIKV